MGNKFIIFLKIFLIVGTSEQIHRRRTYKYIFWQLSHALAILLERAKVGRRFQFLWHFFWFLFFFYFFCFFFESNLFRWHHKSLKICFWMSLKTSLWFWEGLVVASIRFIFLHDEIFWHVFHTFCFVFWVLESEMQYANFAKIRG